ncbi:MAG: flagellar biosynthetic protein FliR [Chromatiales bacterium]|nr:flagellar biosynthetic protein FliR [Chromatiales bacterium]
MTETLQIIEGLMALMWTLLRVGAVIMIVPVFGAMYVPARIRIGIAVVIAFALVQAGHQSPMPEPLSPAGLLAIARELLIGFSIGFVLKLAIDSALLAGQLVSTGMGLSFATVVDPGQGGVPLLGRLYLIVATLLLLATNAHLTLIALVAQSFELMPIGSGGLGAAEARLVVEFVSLMFAGALHLALPAIISILMVNVAFGVVSRAAPTLNLFAVGFPVTLMMGFVIMALSFRSQGAVWSGQLEAAFGTIGRLVGGP